MKEERQLGRRVLKPPCEGRCGKVGSNRAKGGKCNAGKEMEVEKED